MPRSLPGLGNPGLTLCKAVSLTVEDLGAGGASFAAAFWQSWRIEGVKEEGVKVEDVRRREEAKGWARTRPVRPRRATS